MGIIGGYKDSVTFHENEGLTIASGIPGVSLFSGAIRCIAALALGIFNTLRLLATGTQAFGQLLLNKKVTAWEGVCDSTKAIGYNIFKFIQGLFEAIPLIGNIPFWANLGQNPHLKPKYLDYLNQNYEYFFNAPNLR